MVEPQEPTSQALILALAAYILPQALHSPPLCSLDTLSLEISREETPPAKERGRWEPKTKLPPNRSDKHPDTPGSPEGNTEGPGTASSEPLLPS